MSLHTLIMKSLAVAILLAVTIHSSYAAGLFPRSKHAQPPATPSQPGMVPAVPEPETYAFLAVGIGIVAWIVYRRKK
jgi:hypothetical protein